MTLDQLDKTHLIKKFSDSSTNVTPIQYMFDTKLCTLYLDATYGDVLYDYSIAFAQYSDDLANLMSGKTLSDSRNALHIFSDFRKAVIKVNLSDISKNDAHKLIDETIANITQVNEKAKIQETINEIERF